MRMATTVQRSLASAKCEFDVVVHPHSMTSLESARVAAVPAERMAKSVILDDRHGHFLMAVVPASQHLDMSRVRHSGADWQLSSEAAVASLFHDCEVGAVPALGEPYGMKMLVDPQLTRQQDIYLEAGDHEHLLHLRMDDYLKLVPHAEVRELCH
ncbi:YbaK/EbsC family protein [Pseudomonas sp. UL073]|uniref:YbaK/EbsC family protein n=1 Tax=Zestomonas insulae TaxID=2809017 RepID=A0ABS2IN25_9GAMM|nr:YbaK/EbsC family protein [Pseudomonas insulae]MBM7063397.1 YbaK/EbsC family protein [Pseudomonas insulae]